MNKLAAFLTVAYFGVIALANAETAVHAEDAANALSDAPAAVEGVPLAEGAEGHAADVAHAAEHASSGGLPQFEPTWFASQVFWLIISFAVLYFFFSKKTLPDISGVIENRKNHIQSDLETAEKLTAQADAVHDAYQSNLKKAQDAAAKAVHDAESAMKAKSAEFLESFRKRSEAEILGTEERILESRQAMMNDMNSIAADAAAKAVEKIVGKRADIGQVKSVVESLNDITKAKAA